MDAPTRLARRWLRLDAAYCAGAGVLLIVLSARLSRLFHAPSEIFATVGAATLLWALVLAVASRRQQLRRSLALIAAANAAGSAGVAVLAVAAPAVAARLLLVAVAIEVAAFAAVQARLLRQPRSPSERLQ